MLLLDLPPEVFLRITTNYVTTVSAQQAGKAREVSKTFRDYINEELFARQPVSKFKAHVAKRLLERTLRLFLSYRMKILNGAPNLLPILIRATADRLIGFAGYNLASRNMLIKTVTDVIIQHSRHPANLAIAPTSFQCRDLETKRANHIALIVALYAKDEDLVAAILQAGIDPWCQSSLFDPAIYTATRVNSTQLVKMLLSASTKSDADQTPSRMKWQFRILTNSINQATRSGYWTVAGLLLQWAADGFEFLDKIHKLDFIRHSPKYTDYITEGLVKNPSPESALRVCIRTGLLDENSPWESSQHSQYQWLLNFAVHKRGVSLAKAAIAVNACADYSKALRAAIKKNDISMVRFLFDSGVDPEARKHPPAGKTTCELAERGSEVYTAIKFAVCKKMQQLGANYRPPHQRVSVGKKGKEAYVAYTSEAPNFPREAVSGEGVLACGSGNGRNRLSQLYIAELTQLSLERRMKLFSIWSVLLIGAAAEALLPTQVTTEDERYTITPLVNRNGWVNPEDLAPMPQCVAQQDQFVWLGAMTKCTYKQCTRHFGAICTHHQWLTQLSCLGTEFSLDVVKQYLPFCSRSVLAKAQLFHWIHNITGRTWLVDAGDAEAIQTPSRISLTKGYAAVEVLDKAPTCLTESAVGSPTELFRHVMASCSFTSETQHTGNAARPWEYSERQGSMIALDFETAGYDLTSRKLTYGDYFDKKCFCDIFGTNTRREPCSLPGLALTKERLWLNATCGSNSLPADWTYGLKTTTSAYISMEYWRWPECVHSMPEKVTKHFDTCTADACKPDSDGYCDVTRAINRSCFCRSISYDSCKGPCHVFEARVDFVAWLHDLCGNVDGWNGLPKHWRHLTAPTSTDMIPWRWNVRPSKNSDLSRHRLNDCPSTDWKLGSIVLINLATLIAGLHIQNLGLHFVFEQSWILPGLMTAALQLAANWVNAAIVQATTGYEAVSILRLILLWSSMPRLTWFTMLLIILRPSENTVPYTIASCLLAETILQVLSAVPMIQTFNYGLEHAFYSEGMARLQSAPSARLMYAGAAMWLVVIIATVAILLQTARSFTAPPEVHARGIPTSTSSRNLIVSFNNEWLRLEDKIARYWLDKINNLEGEPLAHNDAHPRVSYGTLPAKYHDCRLTRPERGVLRLALIASTSMFLLWMSQWMFWIGFINISSGRYCPPQLWLLTTIWAAFSALVTGAAIMP
ncbi:hypothetical protein OPT61_g2981 [Boeremia exigua]|uniref:Uncharacterized protein n=1 Tax=Boeremia exigua TaxID=749465 RepID=A0ACC2IJM7_9PLEO|nr:hypothetical protein OPT61_g2981 [Boeremia exigua]